MLVFAKFRPVASSQHAFYRLASTKALPKFAAEKPAEIKDVKGPLGLQSPYDAEQGPKTFEEKKKAFLDINQNRIRREELKSELANSAFASIYGFRDTGGKFFRSPTGAFINPLYMPNINGTSLKDGTNGSIMRWLGKKDVSIVRLFSSEVGNRQIDSFTDTLEFGDKIALIDVNAPTSWINKMLVKWYSKKILKSIKGEFHEYMIADTIPPAARKSIMAVNPLGGYIYILDKKGRILWAGSGIASPAEVGTLKKVIADMCKH